MRYLTPAKSFPYYKKLLEAFKKNMYKPAARNFTSIFCEEDYEYDEFDNGIKKTHIYFDSHKCRETFHNEYENSFDFGQDHKMNESGIFLYTCNKNRQEITARLVNQLEEHFNIKKKYQTKIAVLKEQTLAIKPSKFWISVPLRMQFFTIFLRDSIDLAKKNSRSIFKLLDTEYFNETTFAVAAFLTGRTYNKNYCSDGWYEEFTEGGCLYSGQLHDADGFVGNSIKLTCHSLSYPQKKELKYFKYSNPKPKLADADKEKLNKLIVKFAEIQLDQGNLEFESFDEYQDDDYDQDKLERKALALFKEEAAEFLESV